MNFTEVGAPSGSPHRTVGGRWLTPTCSWGPLWAHSTSLCVNLCSVALSCTHPFAVCKLVFCFWLLTCLATTLFCTCETNTCIDSIWLGILLIVKAFCFPHFTLHALQWCSCCVWLLAMEMELRQGRILRRASGHGGRAEKRPDIAEGFRPWRMEKEELRQGRILRRVSGHR